MKNYRLKLASKPVMVAVVIVFTLVAIGASWWLWMLRTHQDGNVLFLYGNVDIREVQLAFRQPGRVAEMMFDEGDSVTAGTPLATLDAIPYKNSLAAAEADVLMARAELAKLRQGLRPQEIVQAREALEQAQSVAAEAERNYRRQSKLLQSGSSSQQTVDTALALRDQAIAAVNAARATLSLANEGFRSEDIAAAEARLAAAQAAQAQAATALADTELVAPSSGTVISRVREPGSMVTSQNAIYSLSLDSPVYVRAYVNEPNLGLIAPGDRVKVYSDSSEKAYEGQIGFISPRAEFTPKTVETTELRTDLVYRLRIVINDSDAIAGLRQGMPVTIEIAISPDTRIGAEAF
ncbi:MAG: secretion protein HlyD [Marinobacter sp.]|uniref:secretion protein HlyD n=1 Tax=Marinobacter sp. TaxID=50741 RepID=UPI00396E1C7A